MGKSKSKSKSKNHKSTTTKTHPEETPSPPTIAQATVEKEEPAPTTTTPPAPPQKAPPPASTSPPSQIQAVEPNDLNLAFKSHYLHLCTTEFATDIEKIRTANDFHASSIPILVRALQQGAEGFSEEEKRRVMGWGDGR